MTKVKKEVIVSGMVQGVGYRYFAYKHAKSLGINGFAENLASGKVKVLAIGEEDNVREFIKKLRQGPYSASVRDVDVRDAEVTESYNSFGMY